MNVLLLSAAAKIPLLKAFQAAVRLLAGRVLATDLDPLAPARQFAEQWLELPASDAPGFADALVSACKAEDIELIIPTRDNELAILADLAPRLRDNNVQCAISPPESIALCRRKDRFVAFCAANGYPIPRVFHDPEEAHGAVLFARPIEGSAGRGAQTLSPANAARLNPRAQWLFQEVIDAPEYSIDLLADFTGRPLQAVARRRLRVTNGEAVVSQVEDRPELTALAMQLSAALKLSGHILIQAFLDPQRGPLLIEVNPRFGGASTLAIAAGLASPERLIQLARGDYDAAARPRRIRHGLRMIRHATDLFIE